MTLYEQIQEMEFEIEELESHRDSREEDGATDEELEELQAEIDDYKFDLRELYADYEESNERYNPMKDVGMCAADFC